MSILKTPFRYDFVGSFLRPEKLKQAKKDFSEGKITEKELNDITDECVRDIVTKQKAAQSAWQTANGSDRQVYASWDKDSSHANC